MDNSMFGILPCTAASKVYALQPITEPALSITLFHLWCCSPSRLPQQTSKIFSTSYCTSIPASSGKKTQLISFWHPQYWSSSSVCFFSVGAQVLVLLLDAQNTKEWCSNLIPSLWNHHHLPGLCHIQHHIHWSVDLFSSSSPSLIHPVNAERTSACGLDPALLEVWGIQVDVSDVFLFKKKCLSHLRSK